MTVASATSRNDYVGNGATATYSYTFRVFAAADLRVTKVDTAGVETTLVYLTDYTVTGVGSFSGGTITLTAGNLPSGHGLTIRFRSTLTQQTDIRNQSGFFPEVIEDALDRLTKLDQQQQDEVDRSIKLPETETGTMTIPTLALRRSSFLGFDASGVLTAGAALSSATPASVFVQTLLDDLTSGAFVETLRNALTAKAAPAVADEVILRDTSVTLGKRMALSDLFKVITALTAETAPDAADELAIYDASAATADKVTLSVLADAIRALTAAKSGASAAQNYSLAPAAAANALTMTLSGAAAVLSATNKAPFTFRSATAATGTPSTLDAVADLSLVLSSGSTLGATSGVAFNLWWAIVDDAGTLRLAVRNCSTATAIYPIGDDILITSTAEGGAGAADSAGVWYTGVAVTAKAARILGYTEHSLAVAGTWNEVPDKIQLWQPGMKLPGDVVQRISHVDLAMATGTIVTPHDDTIPQITEGNPFMTAPAFTPSSPGNLLDIQHSAFYGSGAAGYFTVALHRDAVADALTANSQYDASSNTIFSAPLTHRMVANTVSSIVFRIRAGSVNAGTVTFLGSGGVRVYGGVGAGRLEITELKG